MEIPSWSPVLVFDHCDSEKVLPIIYQNSLCLIWCQFVLVLVLCISKRSLAPPSLYLPHLGIEDSSKYHWSSHFFTHVQSTSRQFGYKGAKGDCIKVLLKSA